jgi:hypothetical protein
LESRSCPPSLWAPSIWATALPMVFGEFAGEPSDGALEAPVQTVRGDDASVERRLRGGLLRCPCSGVLGPWGWSRMRKITTPAGVDEVSPRRARCRSCGMTHVLLPATLFARRAFAGALMWACVLARASGSKIAAIVARFGVKVSTVASWLRRIGGRADWWRQVLIGELGRLDGQVRQFVPAGSALGDAIAVLDAVLAALRGRDAQMATVTPCELASHLTRAHLFAPSLDLDGCNTSVF